MKKRCQRKKCRHCGKWFQPDHRTRKRQKFCAKTACQKARKRLTAWIWRQDESNRSDEHDVARVRVWRSCHPGYYHQLRRMIHRHEKKTGLSMAITPHTFRRSCTTEMLRGGAGMYHIKEMLGHESLDTLKHYAKLTIIDLKNAHARCHPREKDGEASSV